jgi:hypothetical protein
MPQNDIYNFLKENNLTQKDEKSFLEEYSNPEKAKELFGFFQSNELTKKDFNSFYDTYLKKKEPSISSSGKLPLLQETNPLQQGDYITSGKIITDASKSITNASKSVQPKQKSNQFLEIGETVTPKTPVNKAGFPIGIKPKRDDTENEERGWILNTISALDKGFYKNFVGSPIKGLGTLLQQGTKKIIGGTGEGFISDALIKFGDSFNNAIDELTPQDERFKNSLSDQFAQAFGQVGSMVVTSGIGGAASKGASAASQLAPKAFGTTTALKEIGSNLLNPSAVSAGLVMGQSEFDKAKKIGATDDQAFEAFYKNAVVGSVLEKIPVMQFMKRFNKYTGGGVVNYIKTKGVEGIKGGLEEMTTEVLQQLYANKTAKDIYNVNQSLYEGLTENGGIGFGVGFLLNAMGAKAKLLKQEGKNSEAKLIENQTKEFEQKAEAKPSSTNNTVSTKIAVLGKKSGGEASLSSLQKDFQNGIIDENQYNEGVKFIEKATLINDTIPQDLTGENRAIAIELIDERQRLEEELTIREEQKKQIDVAFHKPLDEANKELAKRIKEINFELGKLADGESTTASTNPALSDVESKKQKQLEIINKEKPAPNDYSTWIRNIDDIKTADEAFANAKEDGAMYPDFSEKDMQNALDSGEVTVYSSYPIKNGVFVSPSKMNAQEYAGGKGGKLYSQKVKVEDIAWIDEGEGQYAKVSAGTTTDATPTTAVSKPTISKTETVEAPTSPALSDVERTENNFANENESYRIIVGDDAFNDIVESGVVRTNADTKAKKEGGIDLGNRPTAYPSFSKGKASMSYAKENANHYIIVTEDASIQPSKSGRHGKGTTMFPTDENGNHLKELSGEKVKVYKHLGNGKYELVYENGKLVGKPESKPTNPALSDVEIKIPEDGGGNWRQKFNEEKDPFVKSQILRAIAETNTSDKAFSDILDAVEGMPEESQIAWAIANNPNSSKKVFERAVSNKELLNNTTEENINSLREKRFGKTAIESKSEASNPALSGWAKEQADIEADTKLTPEQKEKAKIESTAKALEEEDATFTADLTDSDLDINSKKQYAQKQIKVNNIESNGAYALIERAIEKVEGLSVNNIFDLAKRIAKLDRKPILIEHIAEAIQYEYGRVENEKDTFNLSIDDAKDVLLNWSKDAEPANKTRMDEIGIVGKTYRGRINKLKTAKNQYEKLNEQGKALIKSFLNKYNDTIVEDAKLITDEYLQILLDITNTSELADVAENIRKSVQKIEDKEAIQLSKLPPVKEPLKNTENTEQALKRFSSQQLSELPLFNRRSIEKMVSEQLKKSKEVFVYTPFAEFYGLPSKVKKVRLDNNGNVDLLDKNDKNVSGKKLTKDEFIDIAQQIGNSQTRKDAYTISEAYHKAKLDGSNPELVAAVEELIGTKQETKTIEQQVQEFGVSKEMAKPVTTMLEKVFEGLKKSGLVVQETLQDWVGVGKGKVDRKALKQIIGEVGAENLPKVKANLQVARDMEKAGKTPKEIWLATGWERTKDKGKWKYDLPDFEFKKGSLDEVTKNQELANSNVVFDLVTYQRNPNGTYNLNLKKKGATKTSEIAEYKNVQESELSTIIDNASVVENIKDGVGNESVMGADLSDAKEIKGEFETFVSGGEKLSRVINAPELFKAYPKLKDVVVVVDKNQNSEGSYSVRDGQIVITLKSNVPIRAKSTLIHEIQHAIQDIEGFARGGNTEMFSDKTFDKNADLKKALIEASSHIFEQLPKELQNEARKINRGEDLDGSALKKIQENKKAKVVWADYVNARKQIEEVSARPEDKVTKTAHQQYKDLAGEVEARNAQKRAEMTPEQRAEQMLSETEDVAEDSKIYIYGANEVQQSIEQTGIEQELADIKVKAQADGIFMKAPNGKPTNLNERQWLHVRTKNFKDWFGDWENDPKNASKVVDSNGEPLVVYHGTRAEEMFTTFENREGNRQSDAPDGTAFFSDNKSVAKTYTKYNKIYEVFLNIKDANEFDFNGADWQGDMYDKYEGDFENEYGDYEFITKENGSQYFDSEEELLNRANELGVSENNVNIRANPFIGYSTNSFVREAIRYNMDGAIIHNVVDSGSNYGYEGESTIYATTNPNQIKSATDNTGEYSKETGNILYQKANAQYRIESGKNLVEAIKDFDGSNEAVIAITHEIMHPTVVSIFDGAAQGNEVGKKHTKTIVDEYNKANPDSKVTEEQMLADNEKFKQGETTKAYRAVQEFIAESWEQYHTEGGKGFSKAFQEVLDQITQAFKDIYGALTGKQLSPELRKMFDSILGEKDEAYHKDLKEVEELIGTKQETTTENKPEVSNEVKENNKKVDVKNRESVDKKIKELESERDDKIKKETKPSDLVELSESDFDNANATIMAKQGEKAIRIHERNKKLKELIDCIWT